MNFTNGVINYALLIFVFVIALVINKMFHKFYFFKFHQKNNLCKLIASFISLVVCVYFAFSVDTLLSLYVDLINMSLAVALKFAAIAGFVFIYLIFYLIIKRIIFKTFSLVGIDHYFSKQTLINRIIVVVTHFLKTTVFVVYLASVFSFLFINLYFNGFTKPLINTHIIKSDFNLLLEDLAYVETAYEEITNFTDLFNKDELYLNLNEFNSLVISIDQKEKEFMQDIYLDLPKETQKEISDLYKKQFNRELKSGYKGIFFILVQDDYYKEILNIPTGFLTKVPGLKTILYRKDLNLTYYRLLEENRPLIEFMNAEQELFSAKTLDYQNLIVSLNLYEEDLIQVKSKESIHIINNTYASISKYFTINTWIVDVILNTEPSYFSREVEAYEIIDEEVNAFLSDKAHLDLVIKRFNTDYQKRKITNRKLFSSAFDFSKKYLKNYQEVSLNIDQKIDPELRLGAAYYKRQVQLDQYIYNEKLLQLFLSYLNADCKTGCDYERNYMYLDMLTYGYLYDFDKKELSDIKLNYLFQTIDEAPNQEAIARELKAFNDQLLVVQDEVSYLEMNYQKGNLSYQVLKLLYLKEDYTSAAFREATLSLLK